MGEQEPGPVVIGMDPHKRTVTIEAMTPTEQIVGHGRFTTDEAGFAAMLEYARRWPQRTWAIEGCEGIGRHVVARLLPLGEQVVDVPALRGQPRPGPLRGRLRQALRSLPRPGLLRPDEPAPAQPRRPPRSQRRALPRRHRPDPLPRTHPRLRHPPHQGRARQTRHHPVLEALPRPRDLPARHDRPPPPTTPCDSNS